MRLEDLNDVLDNILDRARNEVSYPRQTRGESMAYMQALAHTVQHIADVCDGTARRDASYAHDRILAMIDHVRQTGVPGSTA